LSTFCCDLHPDDVISRNIRTYFLKILVFIYSPFYLSNFVKRVREVAPGLSYTELRVLSGLSI